jgi:hypothetical protein
MKRTVYHREYYHRTIVRRRQIARETKSRRQWVRWLLLEIGIPTEIVFTTAKRKPH